jgi:hypothetical protein
MWTCVMKEMFCYFSRNSRFPKWNPRLFLCEWYDPVTNWSLTFSVAEFENFITVHEDF